MSRHSGALPAMREALRVAVAGDADDHARNLSRWHQEYDQFSPGRFRGRITELWLPDLQLFLESTSQALHQTCVAWPDALWFGLPVSRGETARIGAMALAHDALAIRPGGTAFELWTPRDYDILGIVVREEVLVRYAQEVEQVDAYSLLRQYPVAAIDARVRTQATQVLLGLLRSADLPRPGTDVGQAQAALQDQVLAQLVALLATVSASPDRVSPTFLNRQRIVRQVREYLLEHPDENPSIPELCRRFHVSRRTLQYCFEDVVGMSPVRYLRALRLNQVRRRLFFDARHGRVTEAALSWGFRHLSQFSVDYQRLFGILPSDSLRVEADEGGGRFAEF